MKHFGSTVSFTRERNRELISTFRRIVDQSPHISLMDVCRAVAESPTSRFWVSEERAGVVVSLMLKHRRLPKMSPTKKAMFDEIFRRFLILRAQHPKRCVIDLVSEVVYQPAPKLYLTPLSVRELLYRIKKGFYERD